MLRYFFKRDIPVILETRDFVSIMSGRTESVFCKNKRNSGKGAGIGIPLRIPHINSICDLSAFHQKTNVFAFRKSGISETFEVGDGVLQSVFSERVQYILSDSWRQCRQHNSVTVLRSSLSRRRTEAVLWHFPDKILRIHSRTPSQERAEILTESERGLRRSHPSAFRIPVSDGPR